MEIWLYVLQSLAWSAGGFIGGVFAMKLKYEVDEIREAAVPEKDEIVAETYAGPDRRNSTSEGRLAVPRWIGIVIILLSVFTVGQTWYFARQDREVIACQTRTNQQFQEALSARNTVAEEDRRVTDQLVIDVTRATSGEQSRAALEKYLKARAANDAQRAKNPLPGISNCDELRR